MSRGADFGPRGIGIFVTYHRSIGTSSHASLIGKIYRILFLFGRCHHYRQHVLARWRICTIASYRIPDLPSSRRHFSSSSPRKCSDYHCRSKTSVPRNGVHDTAPRHWRSYLSLDTKRRRSKRWMPLLRRSHIPMTRSRSAKPIWLR